MPGGKKDAAAKPKPEETKKDTAPKDKPAAKEEKKGKGKKQPWVYLKPATTLEKGRYHRDLLPLSFSNFFEVIYCWIAEASYVSSLLDSIRIFISRSTQLMILYPTKTTPFVCHFKAYL